MITLALIGVGKWGENYLKTITAINGAKIKYIVSKSKTTLKRFSDEYIKHTDYRDLYKYNDIDGIIVATSGSTHFEIIKDLLNENYFILVEKPMTTNLKDAIHIKENIKNYNKLFVGHIYLYNPAYQRIKQLISEIGVINFISFTGYNLGPVREDMSVLWEWAPHGLSIILDLLGVMPEEVYCFASEVLKPNSGIYDNFYMNLKFKNISCILESSWLHPTRRRELSIYGSNGALFFDDLKDKKVTLYKNLRQELLSNKQINEKLDVSFPEYESLPPLQKELEEFIDFIKDGKKPKTDLNQAINVAMIINAAERSIENGSSIKVIVDTE